MTTLPLEIEERDSSGALLSTYIHTSSSRRIDVLAPPTPKPLIARILDIFLPSGYPASVSPDYTSYQIYDSLQAFTSSIASPLASRAVLAGVGVGDAFASPTHALLLSLAQESVGRLATIAFAARAGTALGPECKAWRLAADVFNDVAMLLDCASPLVPAAWGARLLFLAAAGALRALCGVAAGGAKASLSAHFARADNVADVSAKDASQETVVGLLGILVGGLVVARVQGEAATWVLLLVLLSVHLGANWRAVRAVEMHSLNRQRAGIVLDELLHSGRAMTPREVARTERVWEWGAGVLKGRHRNVIGHCRIGVGLKEFAHCLGGEHERMSGAVTGLVTDLKAVREIYAKEAYMLCYDVTKSTAMIVLEMGATPTDQLKAWCQALVLVRSLEIDMHEGDGGDGDHKRPPGGVGSVAILKRTLERVNGQWERHLQAIRVAGWDLRIAALEIQPGRRMCVVERAENDSEVISDTR